MSERQKKKLKQREANRLKKRLIERVLSTTSNLSLNLLVDGWLELESDPGTFSLLIEDFGCFGAQVDEIYDLEQKFEGPVFGFIFLFKWLNNQSNDRLRNQKSTSTITNSNSREGEQPPEQRQWSYVEDENIIGEMFFAKQMISNSCATHALISILLNCDYGELNLGPTLTRLKDHTKIMNPENRGYAIGNLPELAKAHNSHASFSSLYNRNRTSSHSGSGMSYIISGNQRTNLQQQNLHEAYHFVSYVPINNRLYELDGLKNYPIDHGPVSPKEDWTEKFRSVIKQRLSANKTGDDSSIPNEIRYNLMAVVPDKRVCLRSQLKKLKSHRTIVQDSIQRLTKRVFTPQSVDVDIPNPPYSPLSNGTLTASETGSAYNSPRGLEEGGFLSDDESQINKYFFVKFNQQFDNSSTKEENSEPAHRNCIIELESICDPPLNLTNDVCVTTEKVQESKLNLKLNNIYKDDTKIVEISNGANKDLDEIKTSSNLVENKSPHESSERLGDFTQETQTNGLPTNNEEVDDKVNVVNAHNNDKYNLSSKPPFDFNILDDMQHIHVGKSTLRDMKHLSQQLQNEIAKLEASLKEELDKRKKYKIDNLRRTHNYEPFIMTFLSMLARQGKLADLIEKDLGITSEDSPAVPILNDSAYKINKLTTSATSFKISAANGAMNSKTITTLQTPKNVTPIQKPKYKYVSTGRPVGRPRKNPLVPPPVKTSNTK